MELLLQFSANLINLRFGLATTSQLLRLLLWHWEKKTDALLPVQNFSLRFLKTNRLIGNFCRKVKETLREDVVCCDYRVDDVSNIKARIGTYPGHISTDPPLQIPSGLVTSNGFYILISYLKMASAYSACFNSKLSRQTTQRFLVAAIAYFITSMILFVKNVWSN